MAGYLRARFRLLLFVIVTMALLCAYWISLVFSRKGLRGGLVWRRHWMRLVPHRLGLRTHLESSIPEHHSPVMFVSNHRSYLDPVMIGAWVEGIVIAKHEVSRWPMVGSATKAAGVLFVKREDSESRHAVRQAMHTVLADGLDILNYPEGTTSKTPQLLPFRPGGFRVAAELQCPVIPVAIEFVDPEDAWVGDDTFLRHFFQTFRKRRVIAHVAFGSPVRSSDPEALCDTAYQQIGQMLAVLRERIGHKRAAV